MNGWYAFDLDGTLAYYAGWKGVEEIGFPIPLTVARLKQHLDKGDRVKIFTARVSTPQEGYTIEQITNIIQDWTEKHIGVRLEVTNEKDFGMICLYDDRCVQVEMNTGEIVR